MTFLASVVQEQCNNVPYDYFVAVEVFGSAGCDKQSIRKNFFRKYILLVDKQIGSI
jgi:hypothetical protein